MRHNKCFIKLNFKNKLILAFSIIILVSNLFIGFFNFYETSVILQDDIKMFSSKNLREVNLNLERYFNQYGQIFFNMATSEEFLNWLLAGKGDKIKTSLSYVNILDYYINPIRSIYPEIISINLLNENGNFNTFILKNNMSLVTGNSLDNEEWIRSTKLNNKTNIISGKNTAYKMYDRKAEDLYTIRMARKFSFLPGASGYISIDVDMKPVTQILGEMKYTDRGEGMLLNEAGLVMAHTDTSNISNAFDQTFFNTEIKDKENGYVFDKSENRIIVFDTVKNNGWKAVAIIPYSAVSGGLGKIWTITLIVVGLSLALAIFLVVVLSSSLTARIKKLGISMKQIKMGDFAKRVSVRGNDEITELAGSYNLMLDHLEHYIHDLAEAKLLQQDAVLSALQAQINSHFLYNTLELINSMAYFAGHKEIRKAVVSLSKMFRYTSNYRDTLVTIKDEVDHLKNYLDIMQLQMGERLRYDVEMEDITGDILCLKAIIQPMVENSIKHGIELNDVPGYIKIKIEYNQTHIFVTVLDNGKGFTPEKLMEVRESFNLSGSKNTIREISRVGLTNVNYRLHVFYNNDPETGLRIENTQNPKGARIRMAFPIQRKGEI